MNVLHDIFMGTVYLAGTVVMLVAILGGIGFLVAAITKKR